MALVEWYYQLLSWLTFLNGEWDKMETVALSREDRITLASCYYGLYTIGMAANKSQQIDEDCAMNNVGVPHYEHQLTDRHRQVLAEQMRTELLASFAIAYQFDVGGTWKPRS